MSMIDKKDDEIYKNEQLDSIINSISEDIMVNNIINQINNSLKEKTFQEQVNLFDYFEERYNFLTRIYNYDDNIIKRVTTAFDSILDKIKHNLENLFKFKVKFDDGIEFSTKITLVKGLYEFFIIYIKDNSESLIFNTIDKNVESLKKICKIKNKKDLSYINLKKIINNEYTNIIFCFENIVKNIEIDCNDDVISYMSSDDPDLFCNFYINKIFFDCYCSDIIFEDNLFNIIKSKIINDYSLQLTIKNRLINKYKSI